MNSAVSHGVQCPTALNQARGVVLQRPSMLGRAQQVSIMRQPAGLRSAHLRLASVPTHQSPLSTSCTATADAPTATAAPAASSAPPSPFPTTVSAASLKKKGYELRTKASAAGTKAGKPKKFLTVRPVLPPLPDKLLTCAITRSENWQQLADVYARSCTVMNSIHISTMLSSLAESLKTPGPNSPSDTKESSTHVATDPSNPNDSETATVVQAADITAAPHIPYDNAPGSVQVLLAALEADAIKTLHNMSPRALAATLYGMTKAWALCEKLARSGSKDGGIWKGPSAEFLEAFGVQAARRASDLNSQDLSSILHSLGNLRKASYAPMSKALGPTNPTGVALRTAMLLAVNKALPTMYQPQVISNLALGLANLRYSPGTPLLLELQSASMRVMVPKAGEHPEMLAISNTLWGLSSLVGPQRKVQPSLAGQSDDQEDGSSVKKKKPQPIVSPAFLQAMTVAALSWRRPPRAAPAVTQKEVSQAAKAVRREARQAALALEAAALQLEEGAQHDADADASMQSASQEQEQHTSDATDVEHAPAVTSLDSTAAVASEEGAALPSASTLADESEAGLIASEVKETEPVATAVAVASASARLTLTHATPQLAQNLFWALSRLNYTPTGQMPQMLQDWSRQVLSTADAEVLSLLIGSLAAFQVQDKLDPEWLSDFSDAAAGKMGRARPECVVRVLGALSRLCVSHVDRRLSNALWRHVRTHVGSMYKAEDIMFLILAAEGARRNDVEGAEEGMEVDEELEESGMAAAAKFGSEGVPGSVRVWAPSAGIPWIAIAAAWDAGKCSESVSEILGQRVEAVLSRVREL